MEGDGYYTNLMNETEENNDVPFNLEAPCSAASTLCGQYWQHDAKPEEIKKL